MDEERFDTMTRVLQSPAERDEMRRQFDADLILEHGQQWFDENKARLDADWQAVMEQMGFPEVPPD